MQNPWKSHAKSMEKHHLADTVVGPDGEAPPAMLGAADAHHLCPHLFPQLGLPGRLDLLQTPSS